MEPKSLRDWLLDTGESLATLSAKSNIAKSKLSLVVSGKERAWPDYRARISRALKTTEDQILWPEVTTITVPVDGLAPRRSDDVAEDSESDDIDQESDDDTASASAPAAQAEGNTSALLKDLMALVADQNKTLAEGIATAISGQMQHLVPRNRVHEHVSHRPRSFQNPTGRRDRKLACPSYQNGVRLRVELLHDIEIEKIKELVDLMMRLKLSATKALNGRLAAVLRVDDKGDAALNLAYNNRTVDDRMSMSSELNARGLSGFAGMLAALITETKAKAKERREAMLAEVDL